ncbi:hypothetical protein AZ15_2897 [Bordetella bronchiseptica A1-7]|nr:hypothetical protein [Bordetella bronchiseptica]KDB70339.1 hypothetical protein AZ15_2897 [Bordetella bronchiseptica A1-7]
MKQQLKIALAMAAIVGAAGALGAFVASTSDAPQAPAVRLGDGKAGPAGMAWIPGHQFLMGNDHKQIGRAHV